MAELKRDSKHLETILRELKEAVVACDSNARILLYNSAAKRLFHEYEAMGLGQSLYKVCARAPIETTLRILKNRISDLEYSDDATFDDDFACATLDGKMLLYCHICRMVSGSDQGPVYVFTFEDITREIAETGRQGYLLEKMIKDLRAPLTNLNTAVENLRTYPEMTPRMRKSFEDIVAWESGVLTRRFAAIVLEAEKITHRQWPLFDVYSADLIGCLARRFTEEDGIKVTMTGVPLWLHADSYSLMLVLQRLVVFVRDSCSTEEIDIEALLGDRRVYIDLAWKGAPLPQSAIDTILSETLAETTLTLADVLERHDSEIWSQKHRLEGYSLLRIPIPASPRQWEAPSRPSPERQEFYDFSLAEMGDLKEMADRPLSSLNYVVFDTETTGLRPGEGDEILSISAVRIINGRILSGERFERLIKPQKPIPENSLPFLDITMEMVRDEPPAQVILPKFKAFVNDAVLVAHNGAFDLHFFRSVEEEAGVRLDNPVLDTLLLAAVVDRERSDYTLEGISRWLEIDVPVDKTTMNDCFTTAQVFLGMLEKLEEMGITTLGQAITASEQVIAEKNKPTPTERQG